VQGSSVTMNVSLSLRGFWERGAIAQLRSPFVLTRYQASHTEGTNRALASYKASGSGPIFFEGYTWHEYYQNPFEYRSFDGWIVCPDRHPAPKCLFGKYVMAALTTTIRSLPIGSAERGHDVQCDIRQEYYSARASRNFTRNRASAAGRVGSLGGYRIKLQ